MVASPLIFHHDNDTTAEFDSGLDQEKQRAENTVQSVFYDILGRVKYSGRELSKRCYGTIAVKKLLLPLLLPAIMLVLLLVLLLVQQCAGTKNQKTRRHLDNNNLCCQKVEEHITKQKKKTIIASYHSNSNSNSNSKVFQIIINLIK